MRVPRACARCAWVIPAILVFSLPSAHRDHTAVAQQQTQRPVFRSGTDIALIDVAVVDDAGVPIRGLTAEDFIVTVDGQRRRVEAVDFLQFGVSSPPASSHLNNASSSDSGRGSRTIVVAIDDLSARPAENAGLLAAADRILGSLDPADLVGLVTTSGFGPVVAPTTDRRKLRAALTSREVAGRNDSRSDPFYISAKEAIAFDNRDRRVIGSVEQRECGAGDMNQCGSRLRATARRLAVEARHRRDEQLQAYASILASLRSMPKPRVLIVLGKGLATDGSSNRDEIQRIAHLASEAGVFLYTLTEMADAVDITDRRSTNCLPPCVDHHRARQEESAFLIGGMQIVAKAAGGEAFRVIGTGDRFFERVLLETSGIYRLGVEVANQGETDAAALRITTSKREAIVRVVRHLAGGLNGTENLTIDDAVRQRIAQGGYAFGVPITLALAVRGDPRLDRHELALSARIPASVSGPLSIAFAVLDDDGRVHASGERTLEAATIDNGYDASFFVPVRATSKGYRVRLAAGSGDGRIGSVERRLVPDVADLGIALASRIWLYWSADDRRPRFTVDAVPASATIIASIDLYPKAQTQALRVRVRFSFVNDENSEPYLEHEVAAEPAGAGLRATPRSEISNLPPGEHTVIAAILEAGQLMGRQTAVFRVGTTGTPWQRR